MEKADYIRRYGEAAYKAMLKHISDLDAQRREEVNAKSKKWADSHPAQVQARNKNWFRKTGEHYEKWTHYNMSGLRHLKNQIRVTHEQKWRLYKQIIAPESQLHHEWIPGTADYRGVALVEKDQHMHGFVDVIQILEGEITLLLEAEIRRGI